MALARRPLACALALRLAGALLVHTYIHPDETWQSLEVAHRLAFGYGYATWEWRHGLRGFAHPMLFAAVYRAVRMLGLDGTFLVVAAPYALAAAIAAAADYATLRLADRVAGRDVARWALACSAASMAMATGVTRPLANSAETALAAGAFACWPWGRGGSLLAALVLAALACIVRPTSAALWLCAALALLASQPRARMAVRAARIVGTAACVGAAAVAAMLAIDRVGYGRWVLPPYNFYMFNVHEGLATWFGETPALYHLYASVPILFTSMLPFVLHGIYLAFRTHAVTRAPAVVALGAAVLFSLAGHSEYRFLYPLLPIGHLYAAVSINALAGPLGKPAAAATATMAPPPASPKGAAKRRWWSPATVLAYLLLTNVPPALYLNLVHQRGVVDVMRHLRHGAQAGRVTSIGFLMPCHSTPFYSHLHVDIPMWFLSCEPPLSRAGLDSHYWEAGDFEQHPAEFVREIFAASGPPAPPRSRRQKPSHLVLYDATARRIPHDLAALGYAETARFFNTHFSGDPRRSGDVVVYALSG
ncbi:glycosylphosphatidylinositol anchor biosynthesis [Coemansia javaensis]|uniref:Mannosyltransferase n=1 Tax=Coemansia javaensis TaxID=2761396 RepID=A0A9W8HGK2_9FUNG|nr:glycosylphosphatidylinositol anchor biosynthesis [Coemansia javaensis]